MYLRSLSDITRVRKLDKEGENVEYKSTMQTYTVTLPILLGYIVWFLKNQKKDRDAKNFYAFNPSFDNPCKASCKDCK